MYFTLKKQCFEPFRFILVHPCTEEKTRNKNPSARYLPAWPYILYHIYSILVSCYKKGVNRIRAI
jgi:hypothetical protein